MSKFRLFTGSLCALLFALACSDAVSPARPAAPAFDAASSADSVVVFASTAAITTATPVCAEVTNAATAAGTGTDDGACHGRGNQQFTLSASGAVTVYGGSMCLDAAGGAGNDGDRVIVWPCNGGANQKWARTSAGTITGVNGKCLDVRGTSVGSPLVILTCNGAASQQWTAYSLATQKPLPAPGTPVAPVVPSPVAPVVPPPAAGGTWTRCAGGGEICTGLVAVRDVRLVAPTGAAVQQSFYGQVLCDPAMFGGRNPAPGTPLAQLHCEMGPLKTTTLTNPMPGMAGLGAQVTVAVGDTGASGPVRVASAAVPTQNANDGDFRSQCRLAKYAFDDPIVYPGQPGASHLHVFFGNTAVSAASTAQSLGATGNSTCIGGTLNRTAYWAPALVDARTGAVQTPLLGTFYYKTGYGMDTRALHALPAGLRMIAGDKTNTGYQQYATWSCASGGGTSSIPAGCPAGDVLRLTVTFPQCWDGVHLDSPDHKSHMAYPTYRNPPDQSTCPADHPVPLPVITEFFDYPVPAAGATATWRLSSDMYAASLPGGLSAHADWMMAWDAPTMQTMVSRCLNAARDCQVGLLGDGTALQFP